MNEPRPVPPPGVSQGLPQNTAAPRPAAVGSVAPPQRLPGAGAGPGAQRPLGQPLHHGVGLTQPARATPTASPISFDEDLINLEEDDATPPAPPAPSAVRQAPVALLAPAAPVASISKIRFTGGGDKHNYTKFKRALHADGTGVCRLRSFHGRLSDEGLAFMDDKINEWLDTHPEIEIKLVNTVIGPIEGKNGEQAMFVTLWY